MSGQAAPQTGAEGQQQQQQAAAPAPGTAEHDAAMLARAEAAGIGKKEEPAAGGEQRPAWLPEKFKSAEDLAKAYAELEGKQSQSKPVVADDATQRAAEDKAKAAGVDMSTLTDEFQKAGKLSDETYAALAAKGFDKAAVDTYIAGAQARADAYDQVAFKAAGGSKEELSKITLWAQANMKPDEIAAYNKAVTSGDADFMGLAVGNLKARYDAANGSDPAKLEVPNGGSAGAGGFASVGEMKAAMRDPRYRTDAAYRAGVEAKVKAATF